MKAEARPLYAQVREVILERIVSGVWTAGAALPSEMALAAEIGVSQGTVRKALDQLAADHLVERRQGRGTFVPEQTAERAHFHFFRFEAIDGASLIPEPLSQSLDLVAPPPGPAAALGTGARLLWRIDRRRALAGVPTLIERVYLDPARFPEPGAAADLPNALYSHYQSLAGVTVVRAEDRLMAAAAPPDIAAALDLAPGSPLLGIERTAFDARAEPIEFRESWCRTDGVRYRVTLG
ncbi:MAG: GntR family transcriptional regulator [Pseudomonadota bacterium]